jgi:hypothetical protein
MSLYKLHVSLSGPCQISHVPVYTTHLTFWSLLYFAFPHACYIFHFPLLATFSFPNTSYVSNFPISATFVIFPTHDAFLVSPSPLGFSFLVSPSPLGFSFLVSPCPLGFSFLHTLYFSHSLYQLHFYLLHHCYIYELSIPATGHVTFNFSAPYQTKKK